MHTSEDKLNRILITKGAEHDYFFITGNLLKKAEVKAELNEYLENLKNARCLSKKKLIVKYDTDNLLFFLKAASKFGIIQLWELSGICSIDDYDEELEELGIIKLWLNTDVLED